MDEYMQMRASQVDEGTAKIFKAAVGNIDMASTMLFQIAKQGVAMREKDQPCEKEGGESQVVEGLSAESNFWREAPGLQSSLPSAIGVGSSMALPQSHHTAIPTPGPSQGVHQHSHHEHQTYKPRGTHERPPKSSRSL